MSDANVRLGVVLLDTVCECRFPTRNTFAIHGMGTRGWGFRPNDLTGRSQSFGAPSVGEHGQVNL